MVTETDKEDIKDSIDALVEEYEDRVAELENRNSELEDRVSELEDELAEKPEGIQGAVEAIFSAVGNENPSAGEVDSLMKDIKGLLVTKYGVSAGKL